MIGFGFASDWLSRWREFQNQSQSVIKQNQSNSGLLLTLNYSPFCNLYFLGDLLMQRGKHTSSSQPSSKTPSAISMTFFLEKSTFILQSAVQLSLQQSPHQSHPLCLTTEPSLNQNPSPRPLKYLLQRSPRKHEPQRKPQQLLACKACPALGPLLTVSLWRTLR